MSLRTNMSFLLQSSRCLPGDSVQAHNTDKLCCYWLLVKVLSSTRNKIGHFRDVRQANLLAWYGKRKPSTTKAYIHQWKQMYTQNKHKKL